MRETSAGYHKTCLDITRQKIEGAKGRLREKIAALLLVLTAFKALGQFNVFRYVPHAYCALACLLLLRLWSQPFVNVLAACGKTSWWQCSKRGFCCRVSLFWSYAYVKF